MTRASIVPADSTESLEALAKLLLCYAAEQGWADEQHHIDEIRALPGEYAPPGGRALLAFDDSGAAIGCVVMRPLPDWCTDCVEMRRLYVSPDARGQGVGSALIAASEAWAREAGYASLRLVTLAHMTQALALYERFGFVRTAAYRPSTAENPLYLEKRLR